MNSLAILALTLSVQAAAAPPIGAPCALPSSLSAALKEHFGSSRILKPSDLYEDERGLFSAEHKGACPGMTTGRFFGPKERPAIALVLFDAEPGKPGRLVVARPAMSTWTFFEITEVEAGSTAVVWREGPGIYRGPEEPKIRESKNDVVVLSGYDTWKRAYIWNGRVFDRLQLGD